jgi:hypothetical protein
MRERGPDSRQPLQQEEPPRRQTFRLPIESPQNSFMRATQLLREEAEHACGLFRIGRMQHRDPPNGRDRHECAFDRVIVHVRQRRRRRTFDQQQRSVGTMSESRHLRKVSVRSDPVS